MSERVRGRRLFLGGLLAGAAAGRPGASEGAARPAKQGTRRGAQRLTPDALRRWEALAYGMFIHFGMSTFDGQELSDGRAPAALYAPDALDVDQWVSVARDAGMRYAVLTAKHVAGHCLWPSRHTAYTVAASTDRTDVCERFVDSCRKRGVLPGFYYCSWDNHNRFGSRTPSDEGLKWGNWAGVPAEGQPLAPFTTSVYQSFQTLQLTELLTQYGEVAETWIDIPGVLGPGYREFLYRHVAKLQPETVIMMNSGIGDGETYDTGYAWPSDLIAIERALPPPAGHRRWRQVDGLDYDMPGEVCDPIGKEWFHVEGDRPRPDRALLELYETARARGTNLLLDVPPDRHGRIPEASVQALMRLRRNASL
ncbi:MAG TPA: alpha-L-fucosidase [Vicinamibacteria bacterium]